MSGVGVQPFMPDKLVNQLLGFEGQGADHQSMLRDKRLAVAKDETAWHAGQQVAFRDNPQGISKVVDDGDDRPRTTMQTQPAVNHAQIHA